MLVSDPKRNHVWNESVGRAIFNGGQEVSALVLRQSCPHSVGVIEIDIRQPVGEVGVVVGVQLVFLLGEVFLRFFLVLSAQSIDDSLKIMEYFAVNSFLFGTSA